jgi:hypothetical protein
VLTLASCDGRQVILRLGLAATVLALVLPAADALAADTLWASPLPHNPGNSTCSLVNPCSFRHAVEDIATAGDDVVVQPGDYTTAPTVTPVDGIVVEGRPGAPRPRIIGTPAMLQATLHVGLGTTVRHLRLESTRDNSQVIETAGPATIEDVVAISTASSQGHGVQLRGGSLFRNSTVRATGDFAYATEVINGTSEIRNVTSVNASPSPGSAAIDALTCCGLGAARANIVNSIALGGDADVQAITGGGAAVTATIDVRNSSFRPGTVTDGEGTSFFIDGGGNVAAAPLLVDTAGGDLHEAPGSPTIDAGFDEPFNGAFDIDGQLRVLGSGPDIGADEFGIAPRTTTGAASGVATGSADLAGTVTPNDLPTTYRFELGQSTAYDAQTPDVTLPAGLAEQAAAGHIGHLDAGTTYHYRLVAVNASGSTAGDDATFTTAPAPGLAPPAPPVLSGATLQRPAGKRVLRVTATSADAATLAATGRGKVRGRRAQALRPVSGAATAGGSVTLRFTASKRVRRALARGLARGRRVRATVSVVAYNAAGASAAARRTVKLKK